MLPENTPAAGSLLQFQLREGFPHCWQTCFSVIADMCHHWRNIYCSWDPRLLHFHSLRGLEEDPAGQNAVAVKLYPRLQGQEQRLRKLPLPVFVFIFYLIQSVCFSLIRLFSEDIFNKSKKSPCISELWEGKNQCNQGVDFHSLPPEREVEMPCHM